MPMSNWPAALIEHDWAIDRRLYRLLYELIEHSGFFSDNPDQRPFHTEPELVDNLAYWPPRGNCR